GAGPDGGGLRRQCANSRMRVRASHEGAPGDAGQNDIVDVSTFALNEANVLSAAQRLADVAAVLVRSLRRHRAHPPFSRRWAWRRASRRGLRAYGRNSASNVPNAPES